MATHTESMDFDIRFSDPALAVHEAAIRAFCDEHTHPAWMGFLHLPVSDCLTLDCVWDDTIMAMVVSELDEADAIRIETDSSDPADIVTALEDMLPQLAKMLPKVH